MFEFHRNTYHPMQNFTKSYNNFAGPCPVREEDQGGRVAVEAVAREMDALPPPLALERGAGRALSCNCIHNKMRKTLKKPL